MTLGSGESREVDILRMLTKARDEYTKVSPSPLCTKPDKITHHKVFTGV